MTRKVDRRQISYASYAETYDARRVEGLWNEYLERVRRAALLRAVGTGGRERRVLDVGCGTGRGPVVLRAAGFNDITALDYTEAMLDVARHKLAADRQQGSVRLMRGDAFALPFRDAAFDLVVALRFVHMFKFALQRELISEMARVCRPGGLVVVELESIHKGLLVTRYFEQRRVQTHQKFNSMWEVRELFGGERFVRRRVRGAVLPKLYQLFQHWRESGVRVESIAHVAPFNWMASELVVCGQRR